jgi:hypothetical protein
VAASSYQDTAGNNGGAGATPSLTFDTAAPTVTNVTSSTTDGTYGPGSPISIQVTFSEAVTVTGTPQLTLETGATDQTINYASGSGSNTLTFNYTVQTGDVSADLDYQSAVALALNTGTLKDAAGNDANLALAAPGAATSLGANKAIVISKATTTTVASFAFSADTGISSTDFITKTAAQTISGTTNANLVAGESVEVSINNGATWTAAVAGVGTSNWSLVSTLSASNTLQARVTNALGSSTPRAQAYVLDTTAPTVTVTSPTTTLGLNGTATVTFTFSEDPGTTFDSTDVSLTNGTLGAISGGGLTRSAVFTLTTAAAGGVAVTASSYADMAGNTGGAGSWSAGLAVRTFAAATTATNTGLASASFTGGGVNCAFDTPSSAFRAATTTVGAGGAFPHGWFKFQLINCDTSVVRMTIQWPNLTGVTGAVKYGPTPTNRLSNIFYTPTNPTMDLVNNTTSFDLVDGQQGDDDLTQNGVIVDDVGPIIPAATAQAIPTLSAAGLLALIMSMGLAALAVFRRTGR